MELECAAVRHADPDGQTKLSNWLEGLKANRGTPDFIALEYHPASPEAILATRRGFVADAMSRWPQFARPDLETLSEIIGFEIDAPSRIFPTTQIIYLDKDRRPEDILKVSNQMGGLLLILTAIGGLKMPLNIEQVRSELRAMSSQSQSGQPTPERDAGWHLMLMAQHQSKWGVLIVGADHLMEADGVVKRLLEKAGVQCHVVDLTTPTMP